MKHRRASRHGKKARVAAAAVLIVVAAASCGYAIVRFPPPSFGPDGAPAGAGGGAAAAEPPLRARSPAPAEPAVRATPPAMLQLLVQLLPPGRTSDFATFSGRNELIADLSYRRNDTTNGVRAVLALRPPATPVPERSCDEPGPEQPICLTALPNGADARLGSGPDCSQALITEVDRADGSRIRLEINSCPGSASEADARTALSVAEVMLIAADDQWGRTMRADLVRIGGERFADAPRIREPFSPPRT